MLRHFYASTIFCAYKLHGIVPVKACSKMLSTTSSGILLSCVINWKYETMKYENMWLLVNYLRYYFKLLITVSYLKFKFCPFPNAPDAV